MCPEELFEFFGYPGDGGGKYQERKSTADDASKAADDVEVVRATFSDALSKIHSPLPGSVGPIFLPLPIPLLQNYWLYDGFYNFMGVPLLFIDKTLVMQLLYPRKAKNLC
jgi:hypothetical protein